MTDTAPQPSVPTTDMRTFTIIIYGLYLGALFTGGTSGLVGVVLAYVKRGEARGTLWESHLQNAIHAFWIWFVLMAIGVVTAWFLIGFVVMGAAFVYFLYRTIKGLVRAVDSKPYV
ncbi:MAG TPA: hypothetical protein VHZ78_01425 [Rhizomicrobium sp.]|jgi:uncharacterized membrane protein|nr:hypothetical protein [Rhizomicrobium sp.]